MKKWPFIKVINTFTQAIFVRNKKVRNSSRKKLQFLRNSLLSTLQAYLSSKNSFYNDIGEIMMPAA